MTIAAATMFAGAGCSSRGLGGGAGGASATGGAPSAGSGGAVSGVGGAASGAGGGGGAASGTGGAPAGTGGTTSSTGGTTSSTGGTTSGSGGAGPQLPDASSDSDGSGDRTGCTTSISGTVYDPAGTRPIYNAFVYAPTKALDPIAAGVSCDRCATTLSGAPAAMTSTDATGHFKLQGLPAGTNVPVVIQIGKWRREILIPSVAECVDTAIVDANLTRLPRNQSEGHLPKIAVTTGGSDALECFVHKLGIDDSEFTTDSGNGRVNLFVGGEPAVGGGGQGAASFAPTFGVGTLPPFPPATSLWGFPAKLAAYDMMLLSCEGSQYPDVKLPYTTNVKAYADAGGRIIADHLQFYWLKNGPAPWPTTATYLGAGLDLPDPTAASVNTAFARGAALADWLTSVGATSTRASLQLYGTQSSVAGVTPPTLAWINATDPTLTPTSTKLLTFDTPVESLSNQCGRVAYVDFHVKSTIATQNGKDNSNPSLPFPTGCKSTILTQQEQALEFMLFDAGACIP